MYQGLRLKDDTNMVKLTGLRCENEKIIVAIGSIIVAIGSVLNLNRLRDRQQGHREGGQGVQI